MNFHLSGTYIFILEYDYCFENLNIFPLKDYTVFVTGLQLKRTIQKLFIRNTSFCTLYNLWSENRLKNIWYSFSIFKIIFLQNNQMDFFYKIYNWQFSNCRRSFIFEGLRYKKLKWTITNSSALIGQLIFYIEIYAFGIF